MKIFSISTCSIHVWYIHTSQQKREKMKRNIKRETLMNCWCRKIGFIHQKVFDGRKGTIGLNQGHTTVTKSGQIVLYSWKIAEKLLNIHEYSQFQQIWLDSGQIHRILGLVREFFGLSCEVLPIFTNAPAVFAWAAVKPARAHQESKHLENGWANLKNNHSSI